MREKILLTGGLGYIGSHIYIALKNRGYEPIIYDNMSNSYKSTLLGIKKITGKTPYFIDADIRNSEELEFTINRFDISDVIHLAAKKSVIESVKDPSSYFINNVNGLLNLTKILENRKKKINFIFSSSACIYARSNELPFKENDKISAINPYGLSKIFGEKILECLNKEFFSIAILRYFNPAGAHPSGYIGQNEKSLFSNLITIINKSVINKRSFVPIYGNDYDTPDGTCVRDYFHVMDLADGHVSAFERLKERKNNLIINLGSGQGNTVMQIVNTFSEKLKIPISYKFLSRRVGDVPQMIASIELAEKEIGWKPKYNLDDICQTSYLWSRKLNNE